MSMTPPHPGGEGVMSVSIPNPKVLIQKNRILAKGQ